MSYAAITPAHSVAQNIKEWGGTLAVPTQRYELPYSFGRQAYWFTYRALGQLHGCPPQYWDEQGGSTLHPHPKDVHPLGTADAPWPKTWAEYSAQMKLAGFIRAAAELPRLRKLLTCGGYSRSGATYYGVSPVLAHEWCPSPHRWERWLGKVMRRAALILGPYDTRPSYLILAGLLVARPQSKLPRVGKMAIRLAAACLRRRYALPMDATPLETLVACRLYRQQAVPGDPAETPRGDLAAYGPRSGDDRADIWSPVVVCMARDGAIIRSAGDTINARTTVQVIVTCPTTGLQHRITVPAWFGLTLQEGESAAARVRAAVAWTFGLRPDQYHPQQQS